MPFDPLKFLALCLVGDIAPLRLDGDIKQESKSDPEKFWFDLVFDGQLALEQGRADLARLDGMRMEISGIWSARGSALTVSTLGSLPGDLDEELIGEFFVQQNRRPDRLTEVYLGDDEGERGMEWSVLRGVSLLITDSCMNNPDRLAYKKEDVREAIVRMCIEQAEDFLELSTQVSEEPGQRQPSSGTIVYH